MYLAVVRNVLAILGIGDTNIGDMLLKSYIFFADLCLVCSLLKLGY